MSTQTITSTELQAPVSVPISVETSIEYNKSEYKYADYLPSHIPRRQPPLEEFKHGDPGLRADPRKAALLGAEGAHFKGVTPAIGTEVRGLRLSQLTSQPPRFPCWRESTYSTLAWYCYICRLTTSAFMKLMERLIQC